MLAERKHTRAQLAREWPLEIAGDAWELPHRTRAPQCACIAPSMKMDSHGCYSCVEARHTRMSFVQILGVAALLVSTNDNPWDVRSRVRNGVVHSGNDCRRSQQEVRDTGIEVLWDKILMVEPVDKPRVDEQEWDVG